MLPLRPGQAEELKPQPGDEAGDDPDPSPATAAAPGTTAEGETQSETQETSGGRGGVESENQRLLHSAVTT